MERLLSLMGGAGCAGETGRLAAPFVATAARFAIDERTLLPFTNDSQTS